MANLTLPPNPLSDLLGPEIEMDVVKLVHIACPHKPAGQAAVVITWDNMGPLHSNDAERLTEGLQGIKASGFGRRADSARLLDLAPDDLYPSRLQGWIEETAWALGAGYMMRWSKPPCDRANAGLRHSFGENMYTIVGEPMTRGDHSDALIAQAAESGYWHWEINSAYRKADGSSAFMFESWRKHDPSLEGDGGRRTPWPGWLPSKLEAIAQTYEREDRDGYSLCMPYNMVTRRVDPKLH